ncbi:hypothetical protein [Leifsonia sp. LS-T14]|uniref:hypothetical protein n=1 Tax=unclassified Leifsonia TaxID=2663824 RepID=UPI0035A639A7
MNESNDEAAVLAIMTEAAIRVQQSGGERVYDIALEEGGRLTEYFRAPHGGGAYVLWMNVSDLYDSPNGPQSEELCERTGRQVASEWLATNQDAREQVDNFFVRWSRFPPEPLPAKWGL